MNQPPRAVLAAGAVGLGPAVVLPAAALGLLEPGSALLPVVLLLAFTGLTVALAHTSRLVLRLVSGTGALVVGMALGVVLVNGYYDYYQSWSALTADLGHDNGVAAAPALVPVVRPGEPAPTPMGAPGRGRLVSIAMPGTVSGVYGRDALVWLPPQYDDPRYRRYRFPVLELLHGDPGGPGQWTNGLQLPQVLDREYATHTAAPLVVVMPDVAGGFHDQQCLNAIQGPRLDTYLTSDVPADLARQIRVDPPGRHWGVGGLSAGGFCAARLALRDPTAFGAVAVMDGYFHPDLTPALRRLLYPPHAKPARDDPTTLLRTLPVGTPLPAFWLMAGTANALDYHDAIGFATLVGRREDLRFLTVVGGRHTSPAWRAAFPDLLRWAAATLTGHPAYGQTSVPL